MFAAVDSFLHTDNAFKEANDILRRHYENFNDLLSGLDFKSLNSFSSYLESQSCPSLNIESFYLNGFLVEVEACNSLDIGSKINISHVNYSESVISHWRPHHASKETAMMYLEWKLMGIFAWNSLYVEHMKPHPTWLDKFNRVGLLEKKEFINQIFDETEFTMQRYKALTHNSIF